MSKLTTKYDDNTSNEESSDDEYDNKSESNEHEQPIVEDVIEEDDKEPIPEPQGRGHCIRTKFKQAYIPNTDINCTQ